MERTNGALAWSAAFAQRYRSDLCTDQYPAVGGHGAEMRLEPEAIGRRSRAAARQGVKRRLATIAKLSPGILLEDKDTRWRCTIGWRRTPRRRSMRRCR